MPPFLPRKRLAVTPPPSPRPGTVKKAKLGDSLDAESDKIPALEKARTFSLGRDDSDSSLSDVDSDEFEDVPTKVKPTAGPTPEEEHDEDEDIEWEDAGGQQEVPPPKPSNYTPVATGDLQLTFRKDDDDVVDYGTAATATAGKKGPTKREKEARIITHQLHVQFLLWHNAVRNRWISDRTVQQTLVKQLPHQIKAEVEKWRRASGLPVLEPKSDSKPSSSKAKKKARQKANNERNWGRPSERLEQGKPDMSHGDPINYLLKVLSAYWKKRFAITAPGLRKRGYTTKLALKQDIASFKHDEHNPERHGEKIGNIQEFRELAKRCEGSRDVGAQLFTALLRGLGIESRLVASLQPSGFGWTKAEQAAPRRVAKVNESEESSSQSESDEKPTHKPQSKQTSARKKSAVTTKALKRPRKSIGAKTTPIDLDTDSNTEDDESIEIKDDESVEDITPLIPRQRIAKYDRDNPFPIYWTEAISPITNKIMPVSPLVIGSPVATTPEILLTFEPRGTKAEKAKVVMAYVVGYSSDGTAKDVTTRYLKKRVWPGKTKGFRWPVEKIPVYDKRGRIKRYEDHDWFKRLMSSYRRSEAMRTAVDDLEEATDLQAQEPEKKVSKDDGDTLQSLKSSADFVLERHLRREEALRPNAKADRTFISGKGDNLKEEPVYLRADVERCLTAESWHKEGRRPKEGEAPMKLVPVRAVTLTRKREAEEHHRITGTKQMQGLYSWDQTEYIIPPPIQDGIIPKNSYGNIDCFVPSMVPRGAVHIPLRGTVRICKKLDVDFAEAVTGFEFGNKRAVPVCTGVVVAKEHEKKVRDAWRAYAEERRIKEESKMERLVLDLWRKFVTGLRIRERVAESYGDNAETEIIPAKRSGGTKTEPIDVDDDEGTSHHFAASSAIKQYHDQEEEEDFAGGFLLPDDDGDDGTRDREDLIIQHHEPDEEKPLKSVSKKHSKVKTSSKRRILTPQKSEDDTDLSSSSPSSSSSSNLSSLSSSQEGDDSSDAEEDEDEIEDEDEDYAHTSQKGKGKGKAKAKMIIEKSPAKRKIQGREKSGKSPYF